MHYRLFGELLIVVRLFCFLMSCIALILLSLPAQTELQTKPYQEALSVPGAQYRQFVLRTPSGWPIQINEVLFAPKQTHAQFMMQNPDESISVAQMARRTQRPIAINAGFYTPERKPLGLVWLDKKLKQRASHVSRLLTAQVAIDKHGQVIVQRFDDQFRPYKSAIQTGPLLIDNHELQAEFSNKQQRRSIIAQSEDGSTLIFVTSPASFKALANAMLKKAKRFGVYKIITAAALDGGKSTSLYIGDVSPVVVIPEIEPIVMAIGFS